MRLTDDMSTLLQFLTQNYATEFLCEIIASQKEKGVTTIQKKKSKASLPQRHKSNITTSTVTHIPARSVILIIKRLVRYLHIDLASTGAVHSNRSKTSRRIALPNLTALSKVAGVPPEDSLRVHDSVRTASLGRVDGVRFP